MSRVLPSLWLLLGTVATLAVLWGTTWPLGISGEWEWLRLPADAESALNLLLTLVAAAGYVLVVAIGSQRLEFPRVTRGEVAAWLVVLWAAAFGWLWCVQKTAPTAGSLGKTPFVLYYPGASGYFTHARYEETDFRRFLADYEALMRQGDVLHIGTHPPGLFCVFYGLIDLVDRFPGLAKGLTDLQPESIRQALSIIATNTARTTQPLEPRDGAVLWLAILIAQAVAALTVIPFYGLLRRTLSRAAAYAAAALWPAVPAVAVFLPKSDAVYPALSATLVWLCVETWFNNTSATEQPRPSWGQGLLGFAAGFVAWLGLFCSLAFLPVVVFVKAVSLAELWKRPPGEWLREILVRRWKALVGAMVGFWAPITVLWMTTGMNLLVVWWWNYHNHAAFYSRFPRSYFAWLALNPLELTFAVGWPLMGAALWTGVRWVRESPRLDVSNGGLGKVTALFTGAAVWGLLWLSGKNSGEASRLWLLLMPGLVWLAAHFPKPNSSDDFPALRRQWALLALSLATCAATVHRVGGFHLE